MRKSATLSNAQFRGQRRRGKGLSLRYASREVGRNLEPEGNEAHRIGSLRFEDLLLRGLVQHLLESFGRDWLGQQTLEAAVFRSFQRVSGVVAGDADQYRPVHTYLGS
jgi:hypothetical protein